MNIATNLADALAVHRIVPVAVIDRAADAAPLGAALAAGGLPVAEVTFRTDAAAEAIRILADRGDMLVGAGTVLTPQQVDAAVAAGAQFLVSPGLNPHVVAHAQACGMPIVPGVCTPTEVQHALHLGLELLKFFPADAFGGAATLAALLGPFRDVRFVPTGGVGPDNVLNYLRLSSVVACGGSWMVKPSLYADGDFSAVAAAVREAVQLVATAGS